MDNLDDDIKDLETIIDGINDIISCLDNNKYIGELEDTMAKYEERLENKKEHREERQERVIKEVNQEIRERNHEYWASQF